MFFSHLSPHLAASLQGTTIIQLNPAKDASGLAIANLSFTTGIHYWEIICPYNTEGVKIGISKQQSPSEKFEGHLFEFKTSTQRVVGVLLNLDERTLQFYLNGNLSTNRGVAKLEQSPWYPCVQLSLLGNQICLALSYQDRSSVEMVDVVQLAVQHQQERLHQFKVNNNAIHQFQDRLVSIRNCPLVGQQLKTSELEVLLRMGLVICDYDHNDSIVHLSLNKQAIQQLKKIMQYLRYNIQQLKERFESKPIENVPDILLQEITAMLPTQEQVEQPEKKEEFKFKYSLELCRIAERIILQLIEQFEEVQDLSSAKMRLQTFCDHPATRNPFEFVEMGYYLHPSYGVKYAHCEEGNPQNITYSKLILRSEIAAAGILIPGRSDRYFSLRQQEKIIIYNGEAELFKVAEVDLHILGPYEKHVKQLDAQNDEAPSNIYKILENYLNGETEQLTLYNQGLLEKLVNMGFEEQNCKEILIQTSNNFENALDILSSAVGEWQCTMCTLLNKEPNVVCEACEAPKPEEQPGEQFVIKQAPVIIEENEEISNEIRDAIVNGSIDHVLQVHWDGNICPILIVSVHNGTVLSLRSMGYNSEYLDQFFINEDGYYCKLTNQWSKKKDYDLLLKSKTSRQIVETLAPLYGKHVNKQSMVKIDHKGITVDHQIQKLDYVIWGQKLYLFLLGNNELSIYECASTITKLKKIQIGANSEILVSNRRVLIYDGEKNYVIDEQLVVNELKETIQSAHVKDGEIYYISNNNTKQLDVLDEDILENEEEIIQVVFDDLHDQSFQIGEQFISLHVKAIFEGPVESPQEIAVMNSPLGISNPQKLPLTITSFKGASLNSQTFVTQMLYENNKPFSSNYPKTEFIFRNQFDEEMLVNHVVVKSEITNVYRGFPIGAGLIFISKDENELIDTNTYDNFNKTTYLEWKSKHQSVQSNEPVGYFEFEGEAKEVICHLDVIRPCRFIMLKPTNFRKTPHDHTAHFSMNAIEIKYFAAYGTQVPKVQSDFWSLGTVSDCRLLSELRKRMNLPPSLKVKCQYTGTNELPSNGIIDFEMSFNGQLALKACKDSEYRLLKVIVIGKKCSNLKVNQSDLIEQVYQKKPGAQRVLNILIKKEGERILHDINMHKFILANVLSQEVNDQITEFFCTLQQFDEYHLIFTSVAQQILGKIEKIVLTESGLEYFIGLLTYTAKFKPQQVTDLAIKSLIYAFTKLKSITNQDPHLFSVKYGGPQGQIEIAEEEQIIYGQGNQIPLICHKDPLSQILITQISNKNQIRRFDVNLLGEFQLEKLSLRFQQTANSVKFRVQVWVENLVLDQVYDEWTFVQFTDYVHQQTDVHNFNCLHIGLGGVKARRLLVQLTLGSDNLYSKQPLQIPQNYLTIIPEFYGTLINPQLSPLQTTEDFRYKTTLLLGDTLYYTYQSESSILMDSYNVYQKTDLTDHYIVMSNKSIKRNAEYLETAIHKLQSEMQLKAKCGLPIDHLKILIEQTQLELMKVQAPRNYENNVNFLTAFSALLLRMLLSICGKVENAVEFVRLMINLGDAGIVTDLALQLIQERLRNSIDPSEWDSLMLEYIVSTNIPNSLKQKLLSQLPIPLIVSLEKLIELNDEILFEAIVIQLIRLPTQKITEDEVLANEKLLSLVLQFLVKDPKFRLNLLQNTLTKCTAKQIKNVLTQETLNELTIKGLEHPEKLRTVLDLLFQPHSLESKYTDWAASLMLSESVSNLVQTERDSLTYISKLVIYFCQMYINKNVEILSIDSLLLLFDFLTRSVKKVNKLKQKSSTQLSDFEDFLQRQHIQVCYPDTIQRLIQLLEKQEQFSIWNKVLRVILMMTPQLQNELHIYTQVIRSYVGCGNRLLMNELLQFTLSLSQQDVQQNQTCSQIVEALLPHLGSADIDNIFIIFAQRIQNVYLSNVDALLRYTGIHLPQVGGRDGISNAETRIIQSLELSQSMVYLLLQSEQTLLQLTESMHLNPLIEWYCLNQQSTSTPNSYASQLLKQIADYIEQLFDLLPCKQYLLGQLFAQQYVIDNQIIKNFLNGSLPTYIAHAQSVSILENVQSQFEKYLTSDEIALQFQSDVYHYLINKIIQEKHAIKMQLQEEEFGGKMKVHNLIGQNVPNQDWPLHKKGAKSRLALINMPTGMRSEYQIVFQLDSEIEIKSIKLGIQTYTADFTDRILGTPSSVLLEMGNSQDELHPVQELQIVNDEYFSQFQVKVFSYNTIRCPQRQARFISFRMRAQYPETLEGSKYIKKLCLGISFISVLGYSSKKYPVDFIYSLQEKTALDLLSKFCRPNYQKTLTHLANDQIVLSQLQNSIDKFMNALNTHSYQLSPLIMAIAKYNHKVGDWLVDKLMEHPEQSHSKLLTQIILEGEHVFDRFQRLHNYLFPKLLALQVSNHQQQDLLLYEKLAQHFIETYCNVLLLSSQNSKYKQRELSLEVNKNDIMHLIGLLELLHTKQVRHLLIKLIVNLAYLPHPCIAVENVDEILKFTLVMSRQHSYFLEVLGPLALGSQESVKWMSHELDGIVSKFEPGDLISFFYALSTNTQLCDQLVQYLLPLYNSFIEGEGAKSVLKPFGDKVIELFAKFISYMVQKQIQNEKSRHHAKQIIEALIRDIGKLETVNDMKFVRQLLVPILNSEDYMFVQLLFMDQGRYVSDPKHIVAKQLEAQSPTQELVFESQLLVSKQRDQLFQTIKEICWNKVVYQKNDGDSTILPHLEDRFFTQSPQLMVLNYRLNSVDKTLVLYHSIKSQKVNKLDTTYTWEEGQMRVFHFNGSENLSQVEISFKAAIEIYDEQGTLTFSNGTTQQPFLEIEYVAGEPSRIDLTSLNLQDKGTLESLKIEYFAVGIRQQKQPKIVPPIQIPQDTTQLLFQNVETNQALQYYSVVPVYQMPSQLKISDLKKLISLNRYGLKEDCSLMESHNTLAKLQTNQYNIIELTIDAKIFIENLVLKNQTHTHTQQMTIFPIFEELNGVNVMLSVIKKGITQWKNQQRANAWMQFLSELESFCQLPNFFNLFMKNQLCVNLLFDLIAGAPDHANNKKWEEEEQNAVKFIYTTLVNVFSASGSPEVRIKALEENLIKQILDRIALVSKETKRVYKKVVEQVVKEQSPQKAVAQQKSIKSKKGVGYASDNTGQNQKWNTIEYVEKKTLKSQQLIGLLGIVESFFDFQHWHPSEQLLQKLTNTLFESALLPLLESAFRSGSLLEISKEFELYSKYLKIVQSMAQHKVLANVFLKIPEEYYPQQTSSLLELLTSLSENAQIFLNCMNNSKKRNEDEQHSLEIAKLIIDTHQRMESCISKMNESGSDSSEDEEERLKTQRQMANGLIKEILSKELPDAYRMLLSDLRFNYIDMKVGGRYKHHYQSSISSQINQDKIVRLAQEFADMSTSLPIEHTNAIFVRADKERVDVMKALVMGAKGTPYAHGAFLFDIYADDSYPNAPPKMNLSTTGNGKVRFNPNLYSCGKVCLSLLGTWRGNASENWDPKISTLLQVLVSTQAIIMSEEVYFNEPGFEQEANTEEGEKKNEGYSNIVRYCNIRYAMIDQIRDPPKGFETIVRRHFYLKKAEILEEVNKWIELADTKEAVYTGLLNDHNSSWCNEFKKGKKVYHKKLQEAVKELEDELNKLSPPSAADLEGTKVLRTHIKNQPKVKNIKEDMANLDEVDVSYSQLQQRTFEASDESVQDRWSRYIGAMGMDAVKKQANSTVLISGIGALGVEVAKNIVLSGVKTLTVHDQVNCTLYDLSGQFFIEEKDIGKNRALVTWDKLQQLNSYVRVNYSQDELLTLDFSKFTMVVVCITYPNDTLFKLSELCRQHKVKLIISSVDGVYARIFNDFGQEYIVEDKNGEQTVEYIVKSVAYQLDKTTFTILGKHDFSDNDAVLIDNIEGMLDQNGKSINKTLHKVRVLDKSTVEIPLKEGYSPYIRNGTLKIVKVPTKISFSPYSEEFISKPIFDGNMKTYDFEKLLHSDYMHELYNQRSIENKEFEKMFHHYSKLGEFPPLAAFMGGFVAQEAIKGLTNKFMPVQQLFYTDCCEVLENKISVQEVYARSLTRFVGPELQEKLEKAKVFMVGCGAIGCELLKNFAMLNLGVQGALTITDPDHIEVSNLNRQFLFREKHLHKPKSQTAAAAIIQMNPLLRNHIVARLDKVHDSTEHIYTDQFFENLDIVTNALDNVAARRYVDKRCVNAHVPLLESGTLGPKGHVQCVLPFQTESYGSSNDPVEEGEIPYCTLKMFPEETFHCVEFARDKFGKHFSARPKQLIKMMADDYTPSLEDNKPLRDGVKLLTNRPNSFEDCIKWARGKFQKYFVNDIKQLMYTYPEDAKTKDGNLFWTMPKRPPKPIIFDPQNELHSQFVATFAYLRAKMFSMETNKDWRLKEQRTTVANKAAEITYAEWQPSELKKKNISDKVAENDKQNIENNAETIPDQSTQEETQSLYKQFRSFLPLQLVSDEFEKDNDQNGHIDFIHSFGNLRAANYKLEVMDWLTVKIKAGRIVPALATTTSVVAGLQTIELIKTLKNVKLDQMKNAFINLATPYIQLTEPGTVPKIKINERVTVTLWDRWEQKITKQTTLRELFDRLTKEYDLHPKDVFLKAQPVYMEMMYVKKPEEQKHFLAQPLVKLLDIQKYIDLTINFTLTPENTEILKGIPIVRLTIN